MKPSRYINKIARINILKKKQRTWLSLVSIGLSTAIIFTSLTLFMNIFDFSRSTDFAQSGNFHYATLYATLLTGDAPESSRYSYTYDYDSGQFALYNDQVLNLRQLEMTDNQDLLPFVLKEGRFQKLLMNLSSVQIWDWMSDKHCRSTFRKLRRKLKANSFIRRLTLLH